MKATQEALAKFKAAKRRSFNRMMTPHLDEAITSCLEQRAETDLESALGLTVPMFGDALDREDFDAQRDYERQRDDS